MTKTDIIPTSAGNYVMPKRNRKSKRVKAQNGSSKSVSNSPGAANFAPRANNSNNKRKGQKGTHVSNTRSSGNVTQQSTPSASNRKGKPSTNDTKESAANISEKYDGMSDVIQECPSDCAEDPTRGDSCLHCDPCELYAGQTPARMTSAENLCSDLKSSDRPGEDNDTETTFHEKKCDRLEPYGENCEFQEPISQYCQEPDEEDMYSAPSGFDEVDNRIAPAIPEVIDRTSLETHNTDNSLRRGALKYSKPVVETGGSPKGESPAVRSAPGGPSQVQPDNDTKKSSSTVLQGDDKEDSIHGGSSVKSHKNFARGARTPGWVHLSDSKKEKLMVKMKEKIDEIQDAQLCKVCLMERANRLFRPCGHLSCCDACAGRMKECPICRIPIQGVVVVVYPKLRKKTIGNFVDFDLVLKKNGYFGVTLDD